MTESLHTQQPDKLSRKDRLLELITLLRDGKLHRAEDLAAQLSVSQRSIYRDMDTLVESGVPVGGERGVGFRMTNPVTLPPLNLSMKELEALHLGIAVMSEASDGELNAAARTLASKIDAVLPEGRVAQSTGWGLAAFPFADAAAGIVHMPAIRAAIRKRRKLRITYDELDGTVFEGVISPLTLDYWGRVWTCNVWCERSRSFRILRIDRITRIVAISSSFKDQADALMESLKAQ
jgi:predicted DNA-binding transcriptional regulator YafY